VLDVSAYRGRTFHEADDGSGPEDVVVISHSLWQDVFGGRDAVGRTMTLGGRQYGVIGVMPPGFSFPSAGMQYWITSELETSELATNQDWSYRTVARLAPGRTVEQAAEEMAGIAARLRAEHPEPNRNITAQVVPLHESVVRNARSLLLILAGTIAMVLVIACLNLAGMLLSRGAGAPAGDRCAEGHGRGTRTRPSPCSDGERRHRSPRWCGRIGAGARLPFRHRPVEALEPAQGGRGRQRPRRRRRAAPRRGVGAVVRRPACDDPR